MSSFILFEFNSSDMVQGGEEKFGLPQAGIFCVGIRVRLSNVPVMPFMTRNIIWFGHRSIAGGLCVKIFADGQQNRVFCPDAPKGSIQKCHDSNRLILMDLYSRREMALDLSS